MGWSKNSAADGPISCHDRALPEGFSMKNKLEPCIPCVSKYLRRCMKVGFLIITSILTIQCHIQHFLSGEVSTLTTDLTNKNPNIELAIGTEG